MLFLIFLYNILILFVVEAKSVRRITTQLRQFNLQIQGYSPTQSDDYVAISYPAESGYIVKFEPFASADRVHHMLLYGCGKPAYSTNFWRGGQTCSSSTHIIYAWARNAPSFELPDNVAFSIGHEGDAVQYLVLQIHYANPFVGKVRDFSGLTLHLSDNRPKNLAGVYLFASGTPIPPGESASINNISCSFPTDVVLHPFAFRTHTHQMGRVVSAYVKKLDTGKWLQLGKRNPQWPQLFEHRKINLEIKQGDFLAAMCRFDSSNKTTYTAMGSMGKDEMCNFYMMFYRDADVEDPFPYGAGCFMNENPDLVAQEYPNEGISLLPSHPEMEHMAHQSGKTFGVIEKSKIQNIGNEKLGQISGLAFDNSNNIVVFHRAQRIWDYMTFSADNILQNQTPIDVSTILIGYIGGGDTIRLQAKYGKNMFYMPHSIFVDGSNYFYTTDVGSHQVIKWEIQNGELEPVWKLGEKFVPGTDQNHFCKPAGVVVSHNDGSVYIADGYCNNRIMKFSKDGKFITQWGHSSHYSKEGSFGMGYFSLPHDISLDEQTHQVYVADRENGRVQVFNEQGDPIYMIQNPRLYRTVYSAHFSNVHGLFFIPGAKQQQQGGEEEINVYVVPNKFNKIQYSFRPTTGYFLRPHIVRSNGNQIFVGEIAETGGILWHLEIQSEQQQQQKQQKNNQTNSFFLNKNWRKNFSAKFSENSPKIIDENFFNTILLILFVVGFVYAAYYLIQKFCCLMIGGKKSPQDGIDRKGFKPLKNLDVEDEDLDFENSDNDEDELIQTTTKHSVSLIKKETDM